MRSNFETANLPGPGGAEPAAAREISVTGRYATPRGVAVWILLAALCNAAGWILSGLHQLNLAGYVVFFALALACIAVGQRFNRRSGARLDEATAEPWGIRWRRQRRRFSRFFPFAFLALTALAGLGGVLHAPNNYDALAYRTPRVLHWLAEQQWHWIHTGFHRLNTRGCGMEWMTAPLFVFLRTDRFDFILNLIPFALLPGRVFSLLTRLGVRRRVAWHWMWLLPTGYGYLLQAGSVGNDMFGAWFAMAAVELALRARESGRYGALWLSVLAAALATATKAFNVLLILPWGLAMLPILPLIRRRALATALVIAVGIVCSIVPTAVYDHRYTGDWSGKSAEPGVPFSMGAPLFHFGVNSLIVVLNNFTPPVFPLAKSWEKMVERILPPELSKRLHHHFEPGAATLRLDEMPMEENAGLGFGLSMLLVAALVMRLRNGKKNSAPATEPWWQRRWWVPVGAWGSCVFFLTQSGLSCPTRYLAPYFPLLLAPFLTGPGMERLVRHSRWWFRASAAVFGIAGLLLVLSPSRPLWPAKSVLVALGAESSSQALVRRVWRVYQVYGGRSDALKPLVDLLPPGEGVVGIITFDDPEATLWHPFGARRIWHICAADSAKEIRQRGVRYIWVNQSKFNFLLPDQFEDWLARQDGEVTKEIGLNLRASEGVAAWRLVHLK